MSDSGVDLVRSSIEAFGRGEIEKALAAYAPDAQWHTTGRFADEGVYHGLDGIGRLFAEFRADLEDPRISISEIRAVDGGGIYVAGVMRGQGRQSGVPFEEPVWYVAAVRDRLIARVDAYADEEEARKAAGLIP